MHSSVLGVMGLGPVFVKNSPVLALIAPQAGVETISRLSAVEVLVGVGICLENGRMLMG